ncbi:alpha-L-fucosidase [Polaribacter sp. Q13]|uniref:alpha-L-fucosidase n=1 Tax=Polaribacter sp. Q13 TaxID=2806551 RepID=UPI00193BBB8D|nr:alpha-L-fucosidase [Polaribacter sp. Q13]QVY66099.1 alpha-L-fucosidase [Polaribacter sp. Q13]
MIKKVIPIVIICLLFSCSVKQKKQDIAEKQEKVNLVLSFLNLNFGMFIHYNMGTYHAEQWAKPNHDPKSFAPTNLDCNQWAKAAKSAKMNYAVFTTKHHDGFCLWNTKVTDYDIASSSYKGDIVKEYVDAFRKQDIKIGLYFSVWDRQHKIENKNITPKNIQYTKDQLTELLTNYGDIICIVIDGWGSKWGHGPNFNELPFKVLEDHIHSIQPNCLVINHSCKTDLNVTQLVHYEATHGQHCPYDNTLPSQQGPTLQSTWFWEKGYENQELKSVKSVVEELNFANTHYANYLLNAAPNDAGLMDDNVVNRLKEIGKAVTFSKPLMALPKVEKPHKNVTVTASSSSSDEFKPSNVIDCNLFTRWQFAKEDKKPWIELDFGKPETFNRVICGEFRKGVEKFKIEAFVNGDWKLLAEGNKITNNFNASFEDVTAQKYRMVVLESSQLPKIAEITFVKY